MTLHWLPATPRPHTAVELLERHKRTVILDHQDAYASCSCGWFSTAFLTSDDAHSAVCEVERLLLDSRVRELRLYARLVGH